MITRYVDPDSAGGNGTTNSIASGANAAYASLNLAEAAISGTLADSWEVVCGSNGGGHTADTTSTTFSGATTTASFYVLVRSDANSRASASWSATKYRMEVANGNDIVIGEAHVRIDGLQLRVTAANANLQANINISNTANIPTANNDIRISNCRLRQAGDATYQEPGIYCADADAILSIWNCVIDGAGAYSGTSLATNSAIRLSCATASVYGCTLIGGYYGLYRLGGTVVVKNCYAHGSSAAYSGTMTLTTCASSDSTGTVGLRTIAVNTATFTNVTAGSEDYHLPLGSALIDVGTNTSGDAAPLNFTTDINSAAISGTWDIGAAHYVSAANAFTVTATVAARNATSSATAAHATPAFAGTSTVAIQKSTLSASSTHATPAFTGTATASTRSATATASGSVVAPAFSGTAAIESRKATAALTLSHGAPGAVSGITGVATRKATASIVGSVTAAELSGTADVGTRKSTAQASAEWVPEPISGTAEVGTRAVTVSVLGDFLPFGDVSGTVAIEAPHAVIEASGEVSAPLFTGEAAGATGRCAVAANALFVTIRATGIVRVMLPTIDAAPRTMSAIAAAPRTIPTIDAAPRQLGRLQ